MKHFVNPRHRPWWLWALCGVLVLGGGYYWFFMRGGDSSLTDDFVPNQMGDITTQVSRQQFDSVLTKEGTTKIENEQKMKFAHNGRITAVNVQVGDQVAKGDILATIDSTLANNAVQDAQRALADIQRDIADFEENFVYIVKDRERKLEEANLAKDAAQDQLTKAQEVYDKLADEYAQQNKSGSTLTKAEIERAQQIQTLETKIEEAERTLLTYTGDIEAEDQKIQRQLTTYYKDLDAIYSMLLETVNESYVKEMSDISQFLTKDENRKYYDFFSLTNPKIKSNAEDLYRDAANLMEKMRDTITTNPLPRDPQRLLGLIYQKKKFHKAMAETYNALARGYAATVPIADWSQSDLDSKEASMQSFYRQHLTLSRDESHVETLLKYSTVADPLTKAKSDIEKKRTEAELELSRLRQELKDLRIKAIESDDDLESELAAKKRDLQAAEIALEKSQVEIEKLSKEQSKNTELTTNKEYRNLMDSKEKALSGLEEARKTYEDYILLAPFDGKVAEVTMRVGDTGISSTNQSSESYISLVDPDAIQVIVTLSQSDVIKVQPGAKATITLNAYPDTVFSGEVNDIDAIPSVESGVPEFKARVNLHNVDQKKLYSGMLAHVDIHLNTIPSALVVPFTAVVSDDDGTKYVTRVSSDGKKNKTPVEVGYTDGVYYQILSGLNEGDTILEIDYDPSFFPEDDDPYGGGMMF